MFDRLIENWLINVHELGYQIPFCQVLLREKYQVLHVSRHGRGEHGKDVVARDNAGQLFTFQLKGGDITLPVWREIRGEVEDLVRLPVMLPGIKRAEPHVPVLVTNGEIKGDALLSIQEYSEDWEKKGSPHLKIWQRNELLSKFINSHGTYLPTSLIDFREFVELYISDFKDRLPREKFAQFLSQLVSSEIAVGKGAKTKRAVESMVLMGSYIIEQYERVENHISAAEGWTIVAANIMHIAEREGLSAKQYKPSLDLVWLALQRNLSRLKNEILERSHFVEPAFINAETDNIRGTRVLLTLGWLAATAFIESEDFSENGKIFQVFKRELPNRRLSGEVDWPLNLILSLYMEKVTISSVGEAFICGWVRNVIEANRQKGSPGLPSPYWSQERLLALHYGQLPPYETENFSGHSYTILSALDMLVRRFCRQQVAAFWPDASKITFNDYIPDTAAEWFLWKSTQGELQMIIPQQPASWSKWSEAAAIIKRSSVPAILLNHQEWLLPFALTYPHRVNRALSGLLDCVIGERATLEE